MSQHIVSIDLARSASAYEILIADGSLANCGEWVSSVIGGNKAKIAVVTNPKVETLYGGVVTESLRRAGFEIAVHLIGDGERFKNFRTLQHTLSSFSEAGLTRTDCVLALGGGVVGDLAGFAASVYLRGVRFLQVPTTLLAMIDSSVGGKTGINTEFGKNLVGAFHQPAGVLIDPSTLRTLPKRELTAGFCEAVKHGAISERKLFDETARFLDDFSHTNIRTRWNKELGSRICDLLESQVKFKARIVQGDEFEDPENTAATSRKVLNFGHTFAHALEKATDYKYLKHGEAVGYGIIFAARLSKRLELIDQNEVKLLYDVVHRAGVLPSLSNIDPKAVIDAFTHDKKLINNSLHWILLKSIGNPVIVPNDEIPASFITDTVNKLIQE